MTVRIYPKQIMPLSYDGAITESDIWLAADVECPHCGKEQPVAATGHVGGPCVRCGKPTMGPNVEKPAEAG